ncbi:hypothetical protein ScalyP_jg807 [Parmales sp. scaly parma]|nr:hypothetical protein ScalyP_jg807 [Parmales sp. scaly parma]
MSKFSKKKPPASYEVIQPTLAILDNELRDCVNKSHEGLRKGESIWPVHQINWQRTRYVYDMYYIHQMITRECYDHCVRNKLVDAGLIAKWKKPGYESLCSTFAINSKNYKFGTVSICRVPKSELREENQEIQDPNTGCLGCASGKGGHYNIFGNKYGQRLAAIQVARDKKREQMAKEDAEKELLQEDNKGDSETDDDDESDDDCGPQAAPVKPTDGKKRGGVWASGDAELKESDKYVEGDYADEQAEQGGDEEERAKKKKKTI